MRNVLIVSPHFPPINAPDMQRVRMSLPYFREFGWNPLVLAVAPEHVEGVREPLLLKTIPADVAVRLVAALPVGWTRKVGLGNVALRAFPFLYRAGREMIRSEAVDLVYFSTSMFPAVPLGRIWKQQSGVPFVVDLQDPWVTDYYRDQPARKPRKYWMADVLNRTLEPWTMPKADGLIAVSKAYVETLQQRYPALEKKPRATIPFGAAESDFDLIRSPALAGEAGSNRFFTRDRAHWNGVYVGCGGALMAPALRIAFQALRLGLEQRPELFSKVRLFFIGTDYAPGERARKTIQPLARELGVGAQVFEHEQRIPYFEALRLLLDADFLLVPGTDDPQYTASKIYSYILAHRPLLAIFHEQSSVCGILRSTRAGSLLPFVPERAPDAYAPQFLAMWAEVLARLPFTPSTDWTAFAGYRSREMTRRQCEVFDQVMAGRTAEAYPSAIEVPA